MRVRVARGRVSAVSGPAGPGATGPGPGRRVPVSPEILCIVMIFAIRSFAFAESQSETGHIKWRELSVLPAGISESAREILKKGLINGHNPHSYSDRKSVV